MSEPDSTAYALVQAAHNFGAVMVVGGAVAGLLVPLAASRRKLACTVLAGWLLQAGSGAAFGLTSYYFYHKLPDISGIALAALVVKMMCAVSGITIAALCLRARPPNPAGAWPVLLALGVAALTSAAILRWFS